jgi:hypothetical protein
MRMLTLSKVLTVSAAIVASISCGSVIRDGKSPVYLVVDTLEGSRGNSTPGPFTSGLLISDVITNVTSPDPCTSASPCPTVFGDSGQAQLRMSLKDIGTSPTTPTAPTTNNEVTITRYHVAYIRTDGRNTEGVDVPYAFDGATTGTIPSGGNITLGFELVRNIAKQQAPLIQLKTNPQILQAIANVTFYGHDQVGNEMSVTGSISIEFGNFGD